MHRQEKCIKRIPARRESPDKQTGGIHQTNTCWPESPDNPNWLYEQIRMANTPTQGPVAYNTRAKRTTTAPTDRAQSPPIRRRTGRNLARTKQPEARPPTKGSCWLGNCYIQSITTRTGDKVVCFMNTDGRVRTRHGRIRWKASGVIGGPQVSLDFYTDSFRNTTTIFINGAGFLMTNLVGRFQNYMC